MRLWRRRPKPPPAPEFDALAAAAELQAEMKAALRAGEAASERGDMDALAAASDRVERAWARMVAVRRRQLADMGKTTDPNPVPTTERIEQAALAIYGGTTNRRPWHEVRSHYMAAAESALRAAECHNHMGPDDGVVCWVCDQPTGGPLPLDQAG